MQEMQQEPSKAEKTSRTLPSRMWGRSAVKRSLKYPPTPLDLSELEERVLTQRGQDRLTSAQTEALNILVDIDSNLRRHPDRNPGFGVMACYSIIQRLDRPSVRCDLTSGMASVVEKFPIRALGWPLSKPEIEAALLAVVESVGRIEPSNGSHKKYVGTGFLISKSADGHGIVMTNWHVVREMQNGSMDWVLRDGKIYFTTQFYVDFDGSEKRDASLRARVLNARSHPDPGAPGSRRLDIALLDVDLTPTLPNQSNETGKPLTPVRTDYSIKNSRALNCPVIVIGFPLRTRQLGVCDGVNWTKLMNDIFGEDFGFKRASPGLLTRPVGSYNKAQDPCQWIIGHDASTLKGSSGSPVVSADGSGVFAIHFSGADLQVNHAHSFHDSSAIIREMSR